ncbi:unnamed protein product [Blepharisma stoltei]|uniref:Glutamine-dependent NAD(+) synthetase n=1 Tax=Blepharisma stoltei TaxID=1481888 RepID=A0AAU9J5X4_9CILI|nr:unnamed protein product [Blepharisma stoltei]
MEPTIVTVTTLNNWVLDFAGNQRRIIESIKISKDVHKAKVRIGSELEIPGYSCEDHFLEPDTFFHSWEVLAEVLKLTKTEPYNDILCLVGMCINHHGVLYNCGVFVYNGTVILIKPKLILADDGNYRESRWFTPWSGGTMVMDFTLPRCISELYGQRKSKFGNAMLRTEEGYIIGTECCEELWAPIPSSTSLFLQGAHVVFNQSGSHFSLRKLEKRIDLIKSATNKTGGIYLYANNRGCDGNRMYFDGSSMICVNGRIVASSNQFNLKDIDVLSAAVDLSSIETFRSPANARAMQATESVKLSYPIIDITGFYLLCPSVPCITQPINEPGLSIEEQIAGAPACWLWDYLRRSGAKGFFLPLSGGADSASTLALIGCMCKLVYDSLKSETGYNKEVIESDLRKLIGRLPESPRDLASEIMHSAYLGTVNSSEETKSRSRRAAEEIGSRHYEVVIDKIVESFIGLFTRLSKSKRPEFKANGGTWIEDLALQNIQARSRMIAAYLMGQLLPWHQNKPGYYLILGSGNLEEGLTGYMTKYDNSSADLNPIGGISKVDLKRFLIWASDKLNAPALSEIAFAVPTAELTPLKEGQICQTDEAELGLTYPEMSALARLRKVDHLGPLYTYKKLLSEWRHLSKLEIATKVKRFYTLYGKNRHKMATITPSLHVESYSADDNRYDIRPLFYNFQWEMQFQQIDEDSQSN